MCFINNHADFKDDSNNNGVNIGFFNLNMKWLEGVSIYIDGHVADLDPLKCKWIDSDFYTLHSYTSGPLNIYKVSYPGATLEWSSSPGDLADQEREIFELNGALYLMGCTDAAGVVSGAGRNTILIKLDKTDGSF